MLNTLTHKVLYVPLLLCVLYSSSSMYSAFNPNDNKERRTAMLSLGLGLCVCQQLEYKGLLDNILTATHEWLNKYPSRRNRLQRMPYAKSFRCVEDMLACIADNTLLDSCMAYYAGDSDEQLVKWMTKEHIQKLDRATLVVAMSLTKLTQKENTL